MIKEGDSSRLGDVSLLGDISWIGDVSCGRMLVDSEGSLSWRAEVPANCCSLCIPIWL
jgi:hypothetical protein